MSVKPSLGDREVALLQRVVRPGLANMTPDAARAVLQLNLEQRDRERAHELAIKAQAGALTAHEEAELEIYQRVGRVIEMMWSKARLSLKGVGIEVPAAGDD